MKNIETKVRCDELEAVARRADSLGARFAGVLDQRDTYFAVPRGRLKLRETSEGAELITYERPDEAGARVSSYTVDPVDDPQRLVRAHPVRGVVVKRRELWLLGRTRIHLDRVERLGDFVELETVADAAVDDDLWDEHRRLVAALELDGCERVAGSYVDLLPLDDRGATVA